MNIVGKTIETVTKIRKPEYDDPGWLKLNFTDGTHCIINAGIGSFTGSSEDEYPTFIETGEQREEFVTGFNEALDGA